MNNFKELIIWQKAIELASLVYDITKSFPNDEKFGLTNQLRRASVSVSSNIAEGSGRSGKKDYAMFIGYSLGSLFEIESQLIISRNLNFIDQTIFEDISSRVTELQKMTYSFKQRLVT
ncbi:MAG: four helix bundle protein [Cyclobacteriaceae bacterium]